MESALCSNSTISLLNSLAFFRLLPMRLSANSLGLSHTRSVAPIPETRRSAWQVPSPPAAAMSQSEDFAYNAHGLDYTTELDGRIKHLVIRVRRFDQTPADPVMLEPSDRTEPGVAWSTKELDTEKAPSNTLAAVVGEYLSSNALESARAEGTITTRARARYMVVSPLHHQSKASLYVLIRKERGLCVAQSIAGDPTTSQRMFWYQEFVDEGGDNTTAWRTRWQAWSSALRMFKNDYHTKHMDQDCTSEHHDKEDSVLLEEELDNQSLATVELRRNGDKGDLAGLLRDLFKDPQGFDDAEALEKAIKVSCHAPRIPFVG